jgi:hypothetical protein
MKIRIPDQNSLFDLVVRKRFMALCVTSEDSHLFELCLDKPEPLCLSLVGSITLRDTMGGGQELVI